MRVTRTTLAIGVVAAFTAGATIGSMRPAHAEGAMPVKAAHRAAQELTLVTGNRIALTVQTAREQCVEGKTYGVTWMWDNSSRDCLGTTRVHGVDIGYVRGVDGITLTTWAYGGNAGDFGYDDGQDDGSQVILPGYFTDYDS